MNNYLGYKIYSTDEIMLALLTQFDFESFEENEDHFMGYIKADAVDDATKAEIHDLITSHNETTYEVTPIAPQNWNEIWEASFQPVIVNDFCQVRADFHPALPEIQHDIVINPKMAFGTGHHATTYMMIDQMSRIDFEGKSVFDFGCGTGILAILAAKMGSRDIDGVDIEIESYLNTIENSQINDTPWIRSVHGVLEDMRSRSYDVILANINRNILTRYAGSLSEFTASGGTLLLSGILNEDENQVIESFTVVGFTPIETLQKDGWSCIKLLKAQ